MSEASERLTAIDGALIEAMKRRDTLRTSTLRMVRAALKNREIEKRGALDDGEVLQVLTTQVKQRREAIEQFRQGGREELARKEEAELAVLREFMPEEMTPEQLHDLVVECVTEAGAGSLKDMGKVMALVMPQVRGRADGKQVNAMVRSVLSRGDGP